MHVQHSKRVCYSEYRVVKEEIAREVLRVVTDQIATKCATTVKEHGCNQIATQGNFAPERRKGL